MARLSTSGAVAPESTSINLARLISRLQTTLLEPDTETAHRLRTSRFERSKVGAVSDDDCGMSSYDANSITLQNLEYAKTLLLRLEQESANIKSQSKKQDVQNELQAKQDQLDALDGRLNELNAVCYCRTSVSSYLYMSAVAALFPATI